MDADGLEDMRESKKTCKPLADLEARFGALINKTPDLLMWPSVRWAGEDDLFGRTEQLKLVPFRKQKVFEQLTRGAKKTIGSSLKMVSNRLETAHSNREGAISSNSGSQIHIHSKNSGKKADGMRLGASNAREGQQLDRGIQDVITNGPSTGPELDHTQLIDRRNASSTSERANSRRVGSPAQLNRNTLELLGFAGENWRASSPSSASVEETIDSKRSIDRSRVFRNKQVNGGRQGYGQEGGWVDGGEEADDEDDAWPSIVELANEIEWRMLTRRRPQFACEQAFVDKLVELVRSKSVSRSESPDNNGLEVELEGRMLVSGCSSSWSHSCNLAPFRYTRHASAAISGATTGWCGTGRGTGTTRGTRSTSGSRSNSPLGWQQISGPSRRFIAVHRWHRKWGATHLLSNTDQASGKGGLLIPLVTLTKEDGASGDASISVEEEKDDANRLSNNNHNQEPISSSPGSSEGSLDSQTIITDTKNVPRNQQIGRQAGSQVERRLGESGESWQASLNGNKGELDDQDSALGQTGAALFDYEQFSRFSATNRRLAACADARRATPTPAASSTSSQGRPDRKKVGNPRLVARTANSRRQVAPELQSESDILDQLARLW